MCDKSLWWEIKILSRVEDGLEGAEGADINLGVGDCARKRWCDDQIVADKYEKLGAVPRQIRFVDLIRNTIF